MGLSLAQKLTELLSGEIDVDSEVGRGSTFTVRFPRQGPHPASL
jgi:signal transduction histidine kinase